MLEEKRDDADDSSSQRREPMRADLLALRLLQGAVAAAMLLLGLFAWSAGISVIVFVHTSRESHSDLSSCANHAQTSSSHGSASSRWARASARDWRGCL